MATASVAELGRIVRRVITEEQGRNDRAVLRRVQGLTRLITEQVIPRLPGALPEEEAERGDEEPDVEGRQIPLRAVTCNPAILQARARAHEQKASDYAQLWHRERARARPSRAKLAYYRKKSRAHERKAQQYRVRLRRCEDAQNS